jgi:hypothetical protein
MQTLQQGTVSSTQPMQSPPPPPPLRAVTVASVVALCCVSYGNTAQNAFSFDDNFAIVKNSDVTQGCGSLWELATHDFWGRDIRDPLSHKSWRPLTTLSFRLNYMASGLEVAPYHAVNLAAHAAVSVAFLSTVPTPSHTWPMIGV